MDEKSFVFLLNERGIKLTYGQQRQFAKYYELLVEYNKVMNLTGITKKEDVYEKHFYDSLTPAFFYEFTEQKVCDIGSGAGFPLIPIKICFPNLEIFLVDSLQKRCSFLETVTDELELSKVTIIHSRAEGFGQNKLYRETFDIVIARAVAKLVVLSELSLPLVRKGGFFVSMKGAFGSEELDEAQKAISILGGKVVKGEAILLPYEKSQRKLIYIEKKKVSPAKYPRREGIPQKTPLF